jgi:hypothetical protein
VVIGRSDLDHVGADYVEPGQPAQGGEQLPGGEAACLGSAGTGGHPRIHDVDVDRHVHGSDVQPFAHGSDDPVEAEPVVVGAGDHPVPECLGVGQIARGVQRASDPDVQRPVRVDEALLGGPAERRPVRVGLAEVGVPGVEVRVEVQDRDGTVPLVHRPQQGQRDGVITAEREQPIGATEQLVRAGLDGAYGVLDVEGVRGDVTGVRDLLGRERGHVLRRVVRA